MIAYCGLICSECPALIATQKDDTKEREKVAQMWSKEFNSEIKAEDINCEGCLSESDKIFSYCMVCKIRACGIEKGVENCAYCDDYICENLNNFFKMAPDAKSSLDKIRKK